MRNRFPLITITTILLSLALTSCNKSYVCTCTLVKGNSKNTVINYDIAKMKKKEATAECSGKSKAVLGLTYSCKLQ